MPTTLLKKSNGSAREDAARQALLDAGVGVVEVDDWDQAPQALRDCGAAFVVCDSDLESAAMTRITRAMSAGAAREGAGLAPEAARALSHELRTPLSAMAGWVHLLETGSLDEQGFRRAIERLRGNIDDQVRAIERYLGANRLEGHRE